MLSIADARREAARVFERHAADWAWAGAVGRGVAGTEAAGTESVGTELARIPLRIALGKPTEPESTDDVAALTSWAKAWREYRGVGEVQSETRRWRFLGTQTVPKALLLVTPDEVAAAASAVDAWRLLTERLAEVHDDWAAFTLPPAGIVRRIRALGADDWSALLRFLRWADGRDLSALLPRQIPVPGVDGKWFERNRTLVDALRNAGAGPVGQTVVRQRESQVLIRVLDTGLRNQIGGLGEFQASVRELARLPIRPSDVIICENVQCSYSFDDRPATVVLAGQGYAVDVFGQIPWLASARVRYWGDIDTHGFAILNRLRHHLPEATSVLMDDKTLLAHRDLWAVEPTPFRGDLSLLSSAERTTYDGLVRNEHGTGVRLEQERIPWPEVQAAFL